MHGHRSIYCSCDGDCDGAATTVREGTHGLEAVFMEYGVDFFLNGHEHNYERNWPTYKGLSDQSNVNPKAPIYIITGAPGCNELHEPFTRPQPNRSAFRSNNFGYSRMEVHNSSHIRWQQVIMDNGKFFRGVPAKGTVIDDTWIVQKSHGPFSLTDTPVGCGANCAAGADCPPCIESVSRDHWSGRFRSSVLHARTTSWEHTNWTSALIQDFRGEFHGEGKWLRAEVDQLDQFVHYFGDANWEDVRADGSSDGRWQDVGMTGP